MLELKLVKDSLFFNFLEAILDLVDVANVDWSSTGLKLQAVDTEHIVFITLLFPAEDFKQYHCDKDIHMGIPIDGMVKAIRFADKDDTITIKVVDGNFNTITLSIESPKKKNTTACNLQLVNASSQENTTACNLQLVNASSQGFHIPDLQDLKSKYQAFVKTPYAEFISVCKYLSSFGDDGHISVTKEGLKFYAAGTIGCVNIKYMQPEATANIVNMRSPVSVTLDLKYINSFAKACTLFDEVTIGLSTTHPLMVECNIGQMGCIRYFLEPKLATEIDEEEIKTEIEEEEIKTEIEEEKRAVQEGSAATMLELKLVKDSLFFNFLEAILDLVDVANVDWSSTGLKLQAVDTEHIAIITLLFPAEDFKQYHCDKDIHMGIPIDGIVKAIRFADKDDTITIKVVDGKFSTISLLIESPKKKNTTACDLGHVDASSQRFLIPDWQDLESKYQACYKMPSAKFISVCKYLNRFGDFGSISVTKEGLNFYAAGTIGRVYSKYMQPEATSTVVNMRSPVSVFLDLKYMNSFAKACTLFDDVTIGLSTTHPLMVECNIGQMGYIRYFLAPKLVTETDEEEIKTEIEEEEIKTEIEEEETKTEIEEEKTEKKKDLRGRNRAKRSKGADRTGDQRERDGEKKRRRRGSKKKNK